MDSIKALVRFRVANVVCGYDVLILLYKKPGDEIVLKRTIPIKSSLQKSKAITVNFRKTLIKMSFRTSLDYLKKSIRIIN